MPDLLVLVPTFNEAASIGGVLQRIREAVPDAHVLVLDDASPDGTGDIVARLAEDDPHIRVMHRPGKQGLGSAYLAGFDHALQHGYRFVAEIDADGSHDPADLPAMLERAHHADLVIGSRWVPGGGIRHWPRHRVAISRIGNRYARAALGSPVHDLTAGFRIHRTDALRRLDLTGITSQGYCFQVEMAWRLERAGARIVEHPIVFTERTDGTSKMHSGIVAEALWRVTAWGIGSRAAGLRHRLSC